MRALSCSRYGKPKKRHAVHDRMVSMKPGRELDALIAEKVMGLSTKGAPWVSVGMNPNYPEYISYVAPYSTSIADAWEVVEKLKSIAPDFWFSLSRHPRGDGWYVENGPDREEVASGDTAPHAICLAALKAVESPATQAK